MEGGGADNGAGIGGGRLTSAPEGNSVMEPDMWCTSTAVQNVAKVEVMRLRASTYPPKRQKKITVVRRFWSPVRQGGGFSYSMYTKTRTTVRTHRGRRAAPYAQGPQVFVHQQAFHVGGTLHLPGCGVHLLGCACSCTRTPSHHIVFYLFCVVPIASLLCSPHPIPSVQCGRLA